MTPASVARRDARTALAALLPVLAWDLGGLDLPLQRLFGDAAGFAWRGHWLTSGVLHQGGRIAAAVAVALLAVNVARPLFGNTLTRGERLRWLLATLAALAVVPLLKDASATSCPWSLAEFGGVARHVPHWRLGVADGGPGGCFPSGHASSAAAFLTGWFALRARHPVAARRWLAATLALVALLGGAQVVRGAHFVSHVLWTAWVCWVVAAALAAPRPAPVAAVRPAAPGRAGPQSGAP